MIPANAPAARFARREVFGGRASYLGSKVNGVLPKLDQTKPYSYSISSTGMGS
jgi:hypothetical protein